jgi:hypothetical protein
MVYYIKETTAAGTPMVDAMPYDSPEAALAEITRLVTLGAIKDATIEDHNGKVAMSWGQIRYALSNPIISN